VLTVLEGLGNFIKHSISSLFLPTDFQALSFTSPQKTNKICTSFLASTQQKNKKTKSPHQQADAGIFN